MILGSTWRRAAFLFTALALGSCIKHDAPLKDTKPAPPASTAKNVEYAPTKPTGNWGKVEGVEVFGGRGIDAFTPFGEVERVQIGLVKVEGQPFELALRAQVKERSAESWDVQLFANNKQPIAKGDILLATFYMRTEWIAQESGEGQTEFVFELARPPWSKTASQPVKAGREWRKLHVGFEAKQDFAPGEAQAIFRLGYEPETFDLGGITIVNYGKKLALADLPKSQATYSGIEPDAEWRQAAAERIEKIRKAPLTVVVKDKAGHAVTGAAVRATLSKHAFQFGTCVPASQIVDPQADQFRSIVTELFNMATLENDLKWPPLEGEWGKTYTIERATAAADWLNQHGLAVRGHTLVWPGWRNLPRSLRAHQNDPDKLRSLVAEHITDLTGKMKSRLAHWDVVNEPFDNHDLLDILGQNAMTEWFKLARAGDPGAKLFVNDYAILSGGGDDSPHRQHYDKTIQQLIDEGAPLDGIGFQGHFGETLTAPVDVLKLLDRYARFNKALYVTEYDVVMEDEQVAGQYTHDFFTTLFSHPAVSGIVMWGFWDGSHWKNNAPLYRKDWTLKPAGEVYRQLVLDQWRTHVAGKTNAQGAFVTRGFLGDYVIEVTRGAQKKRVQGLLRSSGSEIVVTLG